MKKALIVTFILFGLSTYSHFTKTSHTFINGIFAAANPYHIKPCLGRSLLSTDDDYESTTDIGDEVIYHQVISDGFCRHSLLFRRPQLTRRITVMKEDMTMSVFQVTVSNQK